MYYKRTMGDDEGVSVQAIATTFEILETLRDRDGAGVTELATEVGVSKSAVYNHLSTLSALGYVTQENGRYRLTYGFLQLGLAIRERSPLYTASKSALQTLARTTNETVNLVVPEGTHGVYLYRVGGDEHPIPEGGQLALHASAAGKAILAFWDATRVKEFIEERGLPALTDGTVTDPAALRDQLRSIRDRRVAFDRGEQIPDWQCVASPVVVEGDPIGAVSVSGPADRMRGKRLEEDTTGLVVSTAKSIEISLLESDGRTNTV
ncbi:IclR family transcriptional regulator [Halorubrum vacuolatum]|uniref:Transcriptional regulator, IclR family n=1 Tax=Halorubrum vacuolatum TaxID=63740 RepID=A0A238XM81_HALVU|nr:IclR family transcriptional regulator [Halorubrum vacuolatum]SNR60037.1 transcriptional regulator, IclR family [Halorubrum vacuolatum]